MYGQQPSYGMQPYQQPIYTSPPMMGPPMQQPQTILIVGKQNDPTITNMAHFGDTSQCPFCDRSTKNIMKRKVGCTTVSWCICLLFTTVGLFWIPFCCDGCKDTDCVC